MQTRGNCQYDNYDVIQFISVLLKHVNIAVYWHSTDVATTLKSRYYSGIEN